MKSRRAMDTCDAGKFGKEEDDGDDDDDDDVVGVIYDDYASTPPNPEYYTSCI